MEKIYNPETSEYKCNSCEKYYYLGEEDLQKDFSQVLENNKTENNIRCNLVLFNCNNSLNEPYLQFLILNDNDECSFPYFDITNKYFDNIRENLTPTNPYFNIDDEFKKSITDNLKILFLIEEEEIKKDFDYKGFYYPEDNNTGEIRLFLFFCISENFMDNFEKKEEIKQDSNKGLLFGIFGNTENSSNVEPEPEPSINKDYHIAVVDELSFKKEVNGIKTNENINILFKNEKFMFLKTEKNEMVDIPIVSYNVNIINIDEKKDVEFSKNTLLEPLFFNTPVGKRVIFSNPKEYNKEYQKFIIFIGNAVMILNNNNILINKSEKNYNEYENEEVIIISDLNNNTYYLVKSIVDFVKVPI
jgi:hypothetical protein